MLQSWQGCPSRQDSRAGAREPGQRLSGPFAGPGPVPARPFIGPSALRHSFQPPIVQSFRALWRSSLGRLLLMLGAAAGVVVLAASSVPIRPLEATVQMERLAVKMERAAVLAPETIEAVARIMSHPSYDCRRVPCRLELQQRNEAARDRLHAALSARGPVQDASARESGAHAMQREGF